METVFRSNIRRILALILSAAMILGMDATAFAQEQITEETNLTAEDMPDTAEEVSAASEEISDTAEEVSAASEEISDIAEEVSALDGTEDAILSESDEYIQLDDLVFAQYLKWYSDNCGFVAPVPYSKLDNGKADITKPLRAYIEDQRRFVVKSNFKAKWDEESHQYIGCYNVTDLRDVDKFKNLEYLRLDNLSSIEHISLPGTLKRIDIIDCKFNCALDLSQCPNLTSIRFRNSNIDELDLSANKKITAVSLSQLETINNISLPDSLTAFTIVDCNFDRVLDLSECTNLRRLAIENNTFSKDEFKRIQGFNGDDTSILQNLESISIKNYDINGLPLENFTKVNDLELRDIVSINDISLPNSITKLTVNNCNFDCVLDLSKCVNLKDIVFKTNTFTKDEYKKIKGLSKDDANKINWLESADFSFSDIKELYFGDRGIADEFVFSAESCTELAELSFGSSFNDMPFLKGFEGKSAGSKYEGGVGTGIYYINLMRCSSLKKLQLKIMNYSVRSDFNISGCTSLKDLEVRVINRNAGDMLNVLTSGITGNGEDYKSNIVLTSMGDGAKGTINAYAVENSFIYNDIKGKYDEESKSDETSNNRKYFLNNSSNEGFLPDTTPKFAVFKQDKYNFEKKKLWLDKNSGLREDYVKNPVGLFRGQSIEDETPYFYTKDGYLLDGIDYRVEVENLAIPATLSEEEKSNYQIIEIEGEDAGINEAGNKIYSSMKRVSALNPGKAKLSIFVDGSTSPIIEQIIVVYPTVESLEITNRLRSDLEVDPFPELIAEPGTYDVWTKMTVNDSSKGLEQCIYGDAHWEVYKQNDAGNGWEIFTTATGSGLQIKYNHANEIIYPGDEEKSSCMNDDGEMIANSHLIISEDTPCGIYKIKCILNDNYKTDGAGNILKDENGNNIPITMERQFCIANIAQSSDELRYRSEKSSNKNTDLPKEIDFEALGFGEEYVISSQIRESYFNSKDILQIKTVDENKKYRLCFNSQYTSEEIASYLKELSKTEGVVIETSEKTGKPVISLTVDFVVKKGEATVTTLSKKVKTSGCFSVDYELDGGSFEGDVNNTYCIPFASSDETALKSPTKTGYTFARYMTADGTVVTELGKEALGDITLIAVWARNSTAKPHTHVLDAGEITKEPTETRTGILTYHCVIKGCTYTEIKVVPVLTALEDIVPEDAEKYKEDLTEDTISVAGVLKNVIYTGKAVTFDVRVYKGKRLLKEGTDYKVKYVNNTKVCTDISSDHAPSVVITGMGANAGISETVKFMISPVDIADAYVSNEAALVNGSRIMPKPKVILGGKILKNGTDYKVSYDALHTDGFTVAGSYVITVTGIGSYAGTATSTFTLAENNGVAFMSSVKVSGLKKSLRYADGAAVEQPSYTLKGKIGKEKVTLEKGSDYSVEYVDNKEIGTALMIFKGVDGGRFIGEMIVSFKIVGDPITKAKINYTKKFDFTGRMIKPEPVITLKSGKTLTKGTDYKVGYKKNINAGTATMTITGLGGYSGSVNKTYKIAAISLNNNELVSAVVVPNSVVKATEGAYAGKYVATVEVFYNGMKLTEGKDYTLKFTNNKTAGSAADGKKAPTAVIKGKGNYTKTRNVPFDIVDGSYGL